MKRTLCVIAMLTPHLAQATPQISGAAVCSGVFGQGNFATQGEQIVGPAGNFTARGVNMYWDVLANTDPATVPSTFPGINFMRINFFDQPPQNDDFSVDPQTIAQKVLDLNSRGIVTELEFHNYPDVATGGELTRAASWYAKLAAAFKGNPMVWFGTQNEPHGSVGDVQNQIDTVYGAVRGTGNNTIIMVDPIGGNDPTGYQNLAGKTNVVWDLHYYNWQAGYSGDSGTNQQAFNQMVNAARSVADIPVIIGEYGDSTDGNSIDPGWQAAIDAVQNSGLGTAAWAWNGWGGADWLLNPPFNGGQSELTAFGQKVAANMGNVAPCSGPIIQPVLPNCAVPGDPVVAAAQQALQQASATFSADPAMATTSASGLSGTAPSTVSMQAAKAALSQASASICSVPVLSSDTVQAPPQTPPNDVLTRASPSASQPRPNFQAVQAPQASPEQQTPVTQQEILVTLQQLEAELAAYVPTTGGSGATQTTTNSPGQLSSPAVNGSARNASTTAPIAVSTPIRASSVAPPVSSMSVTPPDQNAAPPPSTQWWRHHKHHDDVTNDNDTDDQ